MTSPLLSSVLTILVMTLVGNLVESKAYNALMSPITKHSNNTQSLFSISLDYNRSFVMDLSIGVSWRRCSTGLILPPIKIAFCRSDYCREARSSIESCPPNNKIIRREPSLLNCHCDATLVNPISDSKNSSCFSSRLLDMIGTISTTDGHKPLPNDVKVVLHMSCAPTAFLSSLPRGISGLATLSRFDLSIPAQISDWRNVAKQFAICLPSTDSSPGVAFFGGGTFFFKHPLDIDVMNYLQYTPLVEGPNVKYGYGYYIGVKGISINGEAVPITAESLDFDSSGRGGVTLSTVDTYTTMRTDIYTVFLKEYERAIGEIPLPRVDSVAPFELCLSTSFREAKVAFQLAGGGEWTIFTNTFIQVSPYMVCLAFVDGGKDAPHAIVIGSYQMEDNFLLFDLVKSRLGFVSLYRLFKITCGHFNFTSGV